MLGDAGIDSPFHAGERAVQERLGVRDIESWARKVIRPSLPEEHREFYSALPFVVAAARDDAGRPWATIVAGAPGFKKTGGVRAMPTPEGVPVKIKSPGSSVQTFDK